MRWSHRRSDHRRVSVSCPRSISTRVPAYPRSESSCRRTSRRPCRSIRGHRRRPLRGYAPSPDAQDQSLHISTPSGSSRGDSRLSSLRQMLRSSWRRGGRRVLWFGMSSGFFLRSLGSVHSDYRTTGGPYTQYERIGMIVAFLHIYRRCISAPKSVVCQHFSIKRHARIPRPCGSRVDTR